MKDTILRYEYTSPATEDADGHLVLCVTREDGAVILGTDRVSSGNQWVAGFVYGGMWAHQQRKGKQ